MGMFEHIATDVPVISTGIGPQHFNNMFSNTTLPMEQLLPVLGIIAVAIIGIIVGVHQFKRWKKFREFEDEMKVLDLNPDQEGTLASMVKRISMDEPVQILFSPRLFDEMASTEIVRVLGSPGSAKAKQEFIDKVYQIRTKTYHPEWSEDLTKDCDSGRSITETGTG